MCFRLLEDILRYIHSIARCVEDNADKPTAKFWRVLLNKAYDLLDKVCSVFCFLQFVVAADSSLSLPCPAQVNSLLPTDTFITVMRGLMGNRLPSVRRKAMELLNNKLHHRTQQWDQQQVTQRHHFNHMIRSHHTTNNNKQQLRIFRLIYLLKFPLRQIIFTAVVLHCLLLCVSGRCAPAADRRPPEDCG